MTLKSDILYTHTGLLLTLPMHDTFSPTINYYPPYVSMGRCIFDVTFFLFCCLFG